MVQRSLAPLLALLLAGGLSACGATDGSSQDSGSVSLTDLQGNTYVAEPADLTGHDLVPGTTLSIEFNDDDEAVSIEAGCNHLFGNAAVSDDHLTVSQLGGTDMGCPQPRMDQDAWIGALLTEGMDLALNGDKLTLSTGDVTINLTQASNAPAPLEGTEWGIEGILDDPDGLGSMSSAPPAATKAGFVIKGPVITINTGCNTGSGPVTYTEDTITAGPIATTRMACTRPGVAHLEQVFLQVLSGPATYTIEKDTMLLTTPDETLGLQLRVR